MKNLTRLIFDSLLILMLLGMLTLPISSIGLLSITNKAKTQDTQVLSSQDTRPTKRILIKEVRQTSESSVSTPSNSKKVNQR